MLSGTARWQDRSTHRIQTDNSVESILRKAKVAEWLEDCGPTSGTVGVSVTGWDTFVKLPGSGRVQPEDVLALWMNDPANEYILKSICPGVDPSAVLDNEVASFYPTALRIVFGADAAYFPGQFSKLTFGFDQVADLASKGAAVMICLKSPGHYLCVVAADPQAKVLVYRDPWPGRTGTDGFNLQMLPAEFAANVKPFGVAIFPQGWPNDR